MDDKGQRNARVVEELGLSIAVERLLRAGFGVAMPIIDEGYDLLATHGRKAWRIQVKATGSTRRSGGHVSIRRGLSKTRLYGSRDVDAFIAVHVVRGYAMCVPRAHKTGRCSISFSERDRYGDFSILHKVKPGL